MTVASKAIAGLLSIAPVTAIAADTISLAQSSVARTGVSGIWMLANISYAGMRAQNSVSTGWRIIAFVFGFPGTLISFIAIREGGERAYGIDIPLRRPRDSGA